MFGVCLLERPTSYLRMISLWAWGWVGPTALPHDLFSDPSKFLSKFQDTHGWDFLKIRTLGEEFHE